MINEERRFAIKTLTDLYSPSSFREAVSRMPDELNDQSGERFNAYFDFLQSLFALRGDYMIMEPEELSLKIQNLKSIAQEFDYRVDFLDYL